jgi:uncharacterized membrane protein
MTEPIVPSPGIGPAGAWVRLAGLSLGLALVLALVGYVPTRAWAGAAGLVGMSAGIIVALVAALAGLVPPLLALREAPARRVGAMFRGIAVRFAVVILLTGAALLSGQFERRSLLVWMLIAYVALMILDSVVLARLAARSAKAEPR